jgi:hypothetical protein
LNDRTANENASVVARNSGCGGGSESDYQDANLHKPHSRYIISDSRFVESQIIWLAGELVNRFGQRRAFFTHSAWIDLTKKALIVAGTITAEPGPQEPFEATYTKSYMRIILFLSPTSSAPNV